MSPKVSVILPVYNAGAFIKEAIQSILNQTFSDFELIVINDGSTDESEKLILDLKDGRIKYFKNATNLGLIATLNKGLGLSSGAYIARMDQDDVSAATRFEKQVAFLDANPKVAVVASRLILVNEQNLETGYWPEDFTTNSVTEIKAMLPRNNCIGHPTAMLRAEAVKKFGYNPKFKNSEDWGLWLTLLSNGYVIAKLNETLLRYRVHQGSTTVAANRLSVNKKVRSFKWAYVKDKLAHSDFKATDWQVLKSLVRDRLKRLFKPVLGPLLQAARTPWLKLLNQFLQVKKQLKAARQPVRLIYIFPFYHTGGAEKVHAAIMEAVNEKNALAFITRQSEDKAFLEKFKAYATVIEVDELVKLGRGKRWLMKQIRDLFSGSLTIMSCNAQFFYELVPHLPEKVKCVDLVHAFVHLNEQGPERWSLPVIARLDARVVINQKTKNDFEYFYKAHYVDPAYLSRIVYIPNFVESKPFVVKHYDPVLKVLYAGRGSVEKRLELIAKAAFELKNKNLPVEFHFAGNVAAYIPAEYLSACVLHGTLTSEKEMEALYAEAHLLIMASSREGFPMVIMEAMMQGTVPLTTAVGGIPEHIHQQENGILIDQTDETEIVKQFVAGITHFLQNKAELARLSKNAHAYAVQHFSREQFFNAYLRLLKP